MFLLITQCVFCVFSDLVVEFCDEVSLEVALLGALYLVVDVGNMLVNILNIYFYLEVSTFLVGIALVWHDTFIFLFTAVRCTLPRSVRN